MNVMLKKTEHWLLIALVITVLSLIKTVFHDWVNWDDPVYISENPLIKDISLEGIKNMFATDQVLGAYIPLVLLSWALDYAYGGLDPMVFHTTNLMLHLFNVGLVFYLVKSLAKRNEIAFITALLFGMHPMHVEAVAWITARKDLLYTLFFLCGLMAYQRYLKKDNTVKYFFILRIAYLLQYNHLLTTISKYHKPLHHFAGGLLCFVLYLNN